MASSASSNSRNCTDEHRLLFRQANQLEFRFEDNGQRPSDPTIIFARLNGSRPGELVEVIASHAPQDFRKPAVDFVACSRQPQDSSETLRFERIAGRAFSRGIAPKCATVAVGEHDFLFQHVIDGLAVEHRSRAARVVRYHAADGGAAGGGNVWSETEAMRTQLRVEFIEHDSRLHTDPPLIRVTSRIWLKYFEVST